MGSGGGGDGPSKKPRFPKKRRQGVGREKEGGTLRGILTPFRFGVNFSYYGLSLDLSGLGLNVYQTQLLFGAVEVPSKLLVYLLVRHVGRRLTQAGMLLGTALALGISLLVPSGEPHPLPGGPASCPRRPALSRKRLLKVQHSGNLPSRELWVSRKARSLPELLFLQRWAHGASPWL